MEVAVVDGTGTSPGVETLFVSSVVWWLCILRRRGDSAIEEGEVLCDFGGSDVANATNF